MGKQTEDQQRAGPGERVRTGWREAYAWRETVRDERPLPFTCFNLIWDFQSQQFRYSGYMDNRNQESFWLKEQRIEFGTVTGRWVGNSGQERAREG